MPCYEYRCEHCKHTEERIEPITTPLIQQCPECKVEDAFVRQISAPRIVFAGGGWYEHGYTK